jgi:hypothetical protein
MDRNEFAYTFGSSATGICSRFNGTDISTHKHGH